MQSYIILISLLTFTAYDLTAQKACTSDSDCIENAVCDNSFCHCKVGHVLIKSKSILTCAQAAFTLGDECQRDIQCTSPLGIYAICHFSLNVTGRCSCRNDSHFSDGVCYKSSRIGESCSVKENCVISSKDIYAACNNGYCSCPPHYHPTADSRDCVPSSELNESCNSDDDCIVAESICDSVCKCRKGYIHNRDKKVCLKVATKLGEYCDDENQCTVNMNNTGCDKSWQRCLCQAYAHEVSGKCWETKELGWRCDYDEECWVSSRNLSLVHCTLNTCQCIKGFKQYRSDCISDASSEQSILSFSLLLVCLFLTAF